MQIGEDNKNQIEEGDSETIIKLTNFQSETKPQLLQSTEAMRKRGAPQHKQRYRKLLPKTRLEPIIIVKSHKNAMRGENKKNDTRQSHHIPTFDEKAGKRSKRREDHSNGLQHF